MARNAEKAQAMLNRIVASKREAARGVDQKRPYLAEECHNLHDAERFRKQILSETAKEISSIQNGALGEHKIRDLNDHINKLLRERKHWERQIKVLGGGDYYTATPRITDSDGSKAMGDGSGYYYFGAARELPGVRELFDRQVAESKKKSRGELYKLVGADYYGYRDDDDGLLVKMEAVSEEKLRVQMIESWKKQQRELKVIRAKKLGMEVPTSFDDNEFVVHEATGEDDIELFKAHVPLPSEKEIEAMIVERKKKELMAKYS